MTMATITEDYVSFNTAQLLRNKGFDEGCHSFYDYAQRLQFIESVIYDSELSEEDNECLAPTHQMAMKWLREVHGLSVETFSIKGTSNICPVFWKGNVVKLLTQARAFSGELVSSYEEAIEAALKYTLENLI